MMMMMNLALLLLCFQLHLLLPSSAHEPLPIQKSTSSPGADLEIPSAKNVIAVDRKGGHGSGGHGGREGGRAHIIPFYGGDRGSHRSNGRHHSGSNRFFTSANLNIAALLFTAILVGI